MRILIIGPSHIPELFAHRPLPGRERMGDEILCVGNGYSDIPFRPGMSWKEMLAVCPEGWKPDIYIHSSPEYTPVPYGMEEADCFTVGVFGDWNLGGHAIRTVADTFDLLVADKPGVSILRSSGFENVVHELLWGYQPELHRILPKSAQETRDIDVLFIGNLNHAVQERRCRALAALARLGGKHNVVLTSGVYGEEYVQLMNRSRIVFNHSVRKELNMRAYEAAACGALLFTELDNEETFEVFQDKVHCVAYTMENMEALLDVYLDPANSEQRIRIAEAGHIKVLPHTYANHLSSLIGKIEHFMENDWKQDISIRPHLGVSNRERRERYAVHYFNVVDRAGVPNVLKILDQSNPNERSLFASFLIEWGRCLIEREARARAFQEAEIILREELNQAVIHPIASLNLAQLYLLQEKPDEGARQMLETLDLLENENIPSEEWRIPIAPRYFDLFTVAQERIWLQYPPYDPEWEIEMRKEVSCRAHDQLGEYYFNNNQFIKAEYHASKSLLIHPERGDYHCLFARSLRAQGKLEQAILAYRKALELQPFLNSCRQELIRLLIDDGRAEQCEQQMDEWNSIQISTLASQEERRALTELKEMVNSSIKNSNTGFVPVLRFLAIPDWREPNEWQSLLSSYLEAYSHPGENSPVKPPSLLMLRVDPAGPAPPEAVLNAVHNYLTLTLRIPTDRIPPITLLNQPLPHADQWKMLKAANILLVTPSLSIEIKQMAVEMELPQFTPEQLCGQRPPTSPLMEEKLCRFN